MISLGRISLSIALIATLLLVASVVITGVFPLWWPISIVIKTAFLMAGVALQMSLIGVVVKFNRIYLVTMGICFLIFLPWFLLWFSG